MGDAVELTHVSGADARAALAEIASWSDPQILGYHHVDYQDLMARILDDTMHCVVARDRTGSIVGALPYRARPTAVGLVINAFPFFGCTGCAVARPGLGDDIVTHLLQSFRDRARQPGVFSAALYGGFRAPAANWVANLDADETLIKFTQYLALGEEPPRWSTKRRGDLRRAEQRGFRARTATPADEPSIWRLYSGTCAAQGIPTKPREFVSGTLAMADRLGTGSPMKWLVATLDETVVAALLFGTSRLTASYILPCADASIRQYQPNAFLMDIAIRHCCTAGMRYWNFESSPAWDDPVFKFKERWGALCEPFPISILYGESRTRPALDDIAKARADAPFYFVAPVGRPTGLWPADVPLPPGFTDLGSSLR